MWLCFFERHVHGGGMEFSVKGSTDLPPSVGDGHIRIDGGGGIGCRRGGTALSPDALFMTAEEE